MAEALSFSRIKYAYGLAAIGHCELIKMKLALQSKRAVKCDNHKDRLPTGLHDAHGSTQPA
jgi:hypothetical protein